MTIYKVVNKSGSNFAWILLSALFFCARAVAAPVDTAVSTPSLPSNNVAVSTSPSFFWTGASSDTISQLGANSFYALQVSSGDAAFGAGNIVISISTPAVVVSTTLPTVDASYVSTFTLTHGTTYYWRVRTVDGLDQSTGPWSQAYSFLVDFAPPVFSAPEVSTDGATGQWTPLPMATYLSSTTATVRLTVQDTAAGLLTSTGLPAGLIAQWHLDESSGTLALDASTNSLSGSLVNSPSRVQGKRGGALSFNGSNTTVSIPHSPMFHPAAGITVSAWIKTSATNDYSGIVHKYGAANDGGYALVMHTSGRVRVDFSNGAGYISAFSQSGISLEDGAWHHLAATYDGSFARLYVDGAAGSYSSGSGYLTSITKALLIGNDDTNAGRFFNGSIDEVRIYSAALSPAQVLAAYQSDTLAAHSRSSAYNVLYSTNAGVSWTAVSTNSVTLDGANGTTAARTLTVSDLQLVASTGPLAATNKVAVVASDYAGNVSTASYTVLVNIPMPPAALGQTFLAVDLSSVTAQWGAGGNLQGVVYNLEASTAGGAQFAAAVTSATLNTSAALEGLLPNTTYFLRVNAAVGDYTQLGSTATLASPVSNAQIYETPDSTHITVNWTPLPAAPPEASSNSASGYLLQASTSANFAGSVFSSATYNVDLATLTVALGVGGDYFLRVGSLNGLNAANFISAGSTSTFTAPTLFSPGDGLPVSTSTPVLAWQANTIGTHRVQLSQNQGFTQVIADSVTANTHYVSTNTLSHASAYWWRAQATAGGPWSSTFTFVADLVPPVFSAPEVSTDGATGQWTPLPMAAYLSSTAATVRLTVQDAAAGLLTSTGLPEGLVAQWHLDEPSGVLALDTSTNSLSGSLVNSPSRVQGKRGGALSFNGSNTTVSIPHSSKLHPASGITISAWIKTSGTNDYSGIIDKYEANYGYELNMHINGAVRFDVGNGSTYMNIQSQGYQGNIEDGAWHHIAGTYDGTYARIYVDGVAGGYAIGSGFLTSNTKALLIGNDDTIASRFFNGSIDEVRIYSVALSSAQIRAAYQSDTLAAHSRSSAYNVLYSTNAGVTWTAVSTNSVTLDGANGTTAARTLTVSGLQLVASTGPLAGTNKVAVAASDYAGNVSTAVYTVLVDTFTPPVLAFPGNGTFVGTSKPVLTWNPATSGVHRLQLSSDEAFTQVIADSTTANAYYISTNTLSHATPYWWRVGSSLTANWSSTASFTVDAVPPVYSAPEVSSDAATGPWTSLPMATYLSSTVAAIRLTVQDPDAGLLTSTGLPAGLVGQWHLDEPAGALALDVSTNSLNGSLVNSPSRVQGKRGGALSFNGADNAYVNLGTPSTLQTTMLTVTAWAKRAANNANHGIVNSVLGGWEFFLAAGNALSFGKAGYSGVAGARTITDTSWHHLAVTYDGSTVNFYIDGALDRTAAYSNPGFSATQKAIGIRPDDSSMRFNGTLDEVRVFSVVRSSAQILADYQSDTLSAHNRGQAYNVLYSTTAGINWTAVSTNSLTLPGGNGSTGPQTLTASNIQLVTSTGPLAATNRVAVVTSDYFGNVSTAVYTILVDVFTPPVPVFPVNGAFVGASTPVLTWSPAAGGVHRLQLSLDEAFTQVIADSTTVNAYYASTNTLSHATPYWWRVGSPINANWSSTASFTVDLVPPAYSGPEVSTDAATGPWTSLPMATYLSSTTATVRFTVQDPDAGLLTSTGLPAGLVGQWHFDESSGTVAFDASTNAYTGSLLGTPVRTVGRFGGALLFGADNAYVNLGTPSTLQTTMLTVTAWAKRAANNANHGIVNSVSGGWEFFLASGNTLSFGKAGFSGVGGARTITDTSWHHLAVTYDGSTASFYIDGVLDRAAAYSNPGFSATQKAIGISPTGLNMEFNGTLDEVRVFSVVRSSAQILADYQSDTLSAHNRGQAYNVLYSTTAGVNWTAVSTNSLTLPGGNGATGSQTLTVSNIPLVNSTVALNNLVAVFASDFTGNVSTASYSLKVNAPMAPAVSGQALLAVNLSSVTAQWGANGNLPGAVYSLEASTDTGAQFAAAVTSATLNTSAALEGLFPNTTYFLRVNAAAGSAVGDYTQFGSTVTLALPVSNVQLYATPDSTHITVNWTPLPAAPPGASSDSASGYLLQASPVADFSSLVSSSRTLNVDLSTLTVQLAGGGTYYLRVASLNWEGTPNYVSAGSTATPAATLTWTGGAGDLNWYTAGNWSPAQLPGPADDLTVDANATIVVNASSPTIRFDSLTLGGSNSPTLKVSTGLAGGGLTVKMNATLEQACTAAFTLGNATVEQGGKITHSANTDTGAPWVPNAVVDLSVSGDFDLQAGATISVNGLGYAGGAVGATGKGPGGGSYEGSGGTGGGGGHGGPGGRGSYGNTGGAAYDSLTAPADLGSGGGGAFNGGAVGGAGGGAVLLSVGGTLTLNGLVTANAGNGTVSTIYGSGGGAGGTVRIAAGTLAGAGLVQANGGAGGSTTGSGGGGSGGRIALVPTSANTSNLSLAAYPGAGPVNGGAGVIYTKDPAQAASFNLTLNGGSVAAGTTTVIPGAALTIDTLTVVNAKVGFEAGSYVTVTSSITLAGTSLLSATTAVFPGADLVGAVTLTVTSATFQGPLTLGGTNTLTLASATFQGPVTMGGVNIVTLSDAWFQGQLTIPAGSSNTITYGAWTWAPQDLTLPAGTTMIQQSTVALSFANLTMQPGSLWRHSANTDTSAPWAPNAIVNLSVSGDFNLQAGATIAVNGLGYAGGAVSGAGKGPGGGTYEGAGGTGGGGGHGGPGGRGSYGNTGGAAHDSLTAPADLGSGGGGAFNGGAVGGTGGGAVLLSVGGTLTLNGQVTANAGGGTVSGIYGSGGGAGGTVNIAAGTLAGAGLVQADGGAGGSTTGSGGGGAGGRIALAISTSAAGFTGSYAANGASGGTGAVAGSTGTAYTGGALFPPAAVSVSFTELYASSVAAQWSANGNFAGTGYSLEASTAAGASFSAHQTSVTLNTSALLQELFTNTTYYFRVAALSGGSTSTYTSLPATSTLALPPSDAALAPVQTDSLTVNWTAYQASPGSMTALGFLFEASTAAFGTAGAVVNSSKTLSGAAGQLAVAGLLTNTTYYARLASLNHNGAPNAVLLASTRTAPGGPPGSPAVSQVFAASAAVSWQPVFSDGYELLASSTAFDGNGTVLSSATPDGGLGQLTVEALLANTTYTLRAGALFGAATSYATDLTGLTLAMPPALSTSTALSSASIRISWDPNGNPGYTLYDVVYSSKSDFSFPASTAALVASPYDVNGLLSDTIYWFKVRAANSAGARTAFDAAVSTRTSSLPLAVTGLAASITGASSMTWTWNPGSFAESYRLYTASSTSLVAEVVGLGYEDTGLSTNAARGLRIAGVNSLGVGPLSAPVTYYTFAAPPAGSSVTARSSYTVTLAWDANGNPAGTTYQVAYSTVDAFETGGVISTSTALTTNPRTLTGLLPLTTYYFHVRSANASAAYSGFDEVISTRTRATNPLITITGVANGGHYKPYVSPVYSFSDPELIYSTAHLNGVPFDSGTPVTELGVSTLTVFARNYSLLEATSTVSFTVDASSPALAITAPGNNISTNAASVTIAYTVSDNFTPTGSILIRNQASQAPPFTFSSQGVQSSTITATDLAGNVSSQTVTFIIDRYPPAAVNDLAVGLTGGTSEFVMTWTAPVSTLTALASYELRYQSSGTIATGWSTATVITNSIQPLAPGGGEAFSVYLATQDVAYTFAVKTRDAAGNLSALSNVPAPYDVQAPKVLSLSPSTSTARSRPAAITAAVSDVSGVAQAVFIVEGVERSTDTSAPYEYYLDISTLADGAHTLGLRVKDALGNEAVRNVNYTVAYQVPPAPAVTSPAQNAAFTDFDPITVSGTAERGLTVALFLNGSSVADSTVTADSAGNFSFPGVSLPSEGVNTIQVRASDYRGSSALSAARAVSRETESPQPPASVTAESLSAGRIKLTWTAPSGSASPAYYRIYRATQSAMLELIPARLIATTTGTLTYTDTPASDNVYHYLLTGMTLGGTQSSSSTVVSAVSDRVVPSVVIAFSSSAPVGPGVCTIYAALSEVLSAPPQMTWTPSGAGAQTLVLTSTAPRNWYGTITVTTATANGTSAFGFSGTDLVGNAGSSITSGSTFVLDTLKPTAQPSFAPASPVSFGTVTITMAFSELVRSTPTLSVVTAAGSTVPVTLALTQGTTVWSGPFLVTGGTGDGVTRLALISTDTLGNIGTALTGSTTWFLTDTTPPAAPQFPGAISQAAGAVMLQWSGPAGGGAWRYAVYRATFSAFVPSAQLRLSSSVVPAGDATGQYTNTPASDGIYHYAVTAIDTAGNEGAAAAITGTSDRTPPGAPLNLYAAVNPQNPAQISLTWQGASGEAADKYKVYRATYTGAAIAGASPIFTISAPQVSANDQPTYNSAFYYRVASQDTAGNLGSACAEQQVTFVNSAPLITISSVANNAYYKTSRTPSWTATDPTLAAESVQGTLDGANFANGASVSTEGVHVLNVRASNTGGLTASATVTFTIDKTSPSVTITGLTAGTTYFAQFTPGFIITDLNTQASSYYLNGAAFTKGSSVTVRGNNSLSATGTDKAGNSSTQTVSFQLYPLAPAPATLAVTVSPNPGLNAALSWSAVSIPGLLGYNVYRDSVQVNNDVLASASFSDYGYDRASVHYYQVAAVDIFYNEGAKTGVTVVPVNLSLGSYGSLDGDGGRALNRKFFDAMRFDAVNYDSQSRTLGPVTVYLLNASNAVISTSAPSGTAATAAGYTSGLTANIAVPSAAPDSAAARGRLKLPSETGTSVYYEDVYPVAARAVTDDVIAVYSDPLVNGTNRSVTVKLFNLGSAPLDVRTWLNGQPVGDLTVNLLNASNFAISSARVFQNTAVTGSVYDGNGQKFFLRVPPGESVTFNPLSLYVPLYTDASLKLQATVSDITFDSDGFTPVSQTVNLSRTETVSVGASSITATAAAQSGSYVQGSSVVITGEVRSASNQLLPGTTVQLGIVYKGFKRTLTAVSNSTGSYSAAFYPAANEAGIYTYWAADPLVVAQLNQGSFTIHGLTMNPNPVTLTMAKGSSLSFNLSLTNPGEAPLTAFSTQTLYGAGTGVTLLTDASTIPGTLNPGQTVNVKFTATATGGASDIAYATFTITAAQGPVRVVPFKVNLLPALPVSNVTPQAFTIGLQAGQERRQTITLKNLGFAPWTNIRLSTPTLNWALVLGATTFGDIAPGGQTTFDLVFQPAAGQSNATYTQNPLINVQSDNLAVIPINAGVTVTSSQNGSLSFQVIDSNSASQAGVAGAEVMLNSLDINGLVYKLNTDANGVAQFNDVPYGNYKYSIQKSGFDAAQNTVFVQPGVAQSLSVVLVRAFVSLTWSVTPTLIQDQYDIKLTVSYQTDVPAPVVTITPNPIDLYMSGGQTAATELKFTNHGLIAAESPRISDTGDAEISIQYPYTALENIPAGQTVAVPIRLALASASCHTRSVCLDYKYRCAAGTEVGAKTCVNVVVGNTCHSTGGGTTSTSGGTAYTGGGGGSGGSSGGFSSGYSSQMISSIAGNNTPPPVKKCGLVCVLEDIGNAAKRFLKCPQCSLGNPVDIVSGEKEESAVDLPISVPIFGLPLSWGRVYGSHNLGSGSLGKGWTHNFGTRINFLGQLANIYQDPLDGKYYKFGGNAADDAIELVNPAGNRMRMTRSGSQYVESAATEQSVVAINGDGTYDWKRRDLSAYHFDSTGKLLSIKDGNNNTVSLTYSGADLVSVQDPTNRTIYTLTYAAGKLASVTDVADRVVNYSYTNGLLTQVAGLNGNTLYQYGGTTGDLLTGRTDPSGKQNTWAYNNVVSTTAAGKPTETSSDGSTVVHARMYASGSSAGTPNPLNSACDIDAGIHQNWYGTSFSTSACSTATFLSGGAANFAAGVTNSQEGAAALISGAGLSSSREHVLATSYQGGSNGFTSTPNFDVSKDTEVTQVRDNLGNTTLYERTRVGKQKLLTAITNPLGQRTSLKYDSTPRLISATNFLGDANQFTYDAKGNVASITDSMGHTTSMVWDQTLNVLTSVTDGKGSASNMTLNGGGNLTAFTNSLGKTMSLAYNAQGLNTQETDYVGNTTAYGYDNLGRLTSVTDPLNRQTLMGYDAAGRLTSVTKANSAANSVTYNAADQITLMTDALSQTISLSYVPGKQRPQQITDQRGKITSFTYDQNGRLLSMTNPLGQVFTESYDAMGRKSQSSTPNGSQRTVSYDSIGRVISLAFSDEQVSFVYLDSQRTQIAENALSKLQIVTDPGGLIQSLVQTDKSDNSSFQTTYAYDANGNCTSMNTPFGTFTYVYDALNRLTSITNYKGQQVTFAYDDNSRLTTRIYPNGVSTLYSYDAASQLTVMTARKSGVDLFAQAFGRDPVGNIASITDFRGTHAFEYDALDRLVSASHPSGSRLQYLNESYTYDAAGNRTTSHMSASHVYNDANRLTSDSNYSYTYDANGNLTAKTSLANGSQVLYAYNGRGRLSSVVDTATGRQTTFKYDPLNRRILKTIVLGAVRQTWKYYYSGGNILQIRIIDVNEAGVSTTSDYKFTSSISLDQPLILHSTQDYFYHEDRLGSIVALTDNSGLIAERIEYDGFGRPTFFSPVSDSTSSVSQINNPFALSAREWEGDTASYYLRERFYDPRLGRFMQEDRLFALNRYLYARNNPVRWSDPLGLFPQDPESQRELKDILKRYREQVLINDEDGWGHGNLGNLGTTTGVKRDKASFFGLFDYPYPQLVAPNDRYNDPTRGKMGFRKGVCFDWRDSILDALDANDVVKLGPYKKWAVAPASRSGPSAHAAVAVYPRGGKPEDGIVLDPWVHGKPDVYDYPKWNND